MKARYIGLLSEGDCKPNYASGMRNETRKVALGGFPCLLINFELSAFLFF